MRTLSLLAVLLALTGVAQAQTTVFRDKRGSITGRSEQRGSTTIFRDDRGSITGRAEQRGDTTIYRDSRGSIIWAAIGG